MGWKIQRLSRHYNISRRESSVYFRTIRKLMLQTPRTDIHIQIKTNIVWVSGCFHKHSSYVISASLTQSQQLQLKFVQLSHHISSLLFCLPIVHVNVPATCYRSKSSLWRDDEGWNVKDITGVAIKFFFYIETGWKRPS